MKRISLILLFVFSNLLLFSQYYWYQGKQIPITEGSKRYVLFNTQKNGQSGQFKQIGETTIPSIKWGIQESDSPLPSGVIYTSPSYKVAHDSIDVYITERFYVKLKHSNDESLLQKFALDNNVEIVKVASVHLWYILKCTEQTKGNSLQTANLFYESGLFAAAQPEFINAYRVTCSNDVYFYDQWNLKNTGQRVPAYNGIDINYCEAHALTTGNSSIIVAVFDQGVELTHEDLNVYNISYDTETASSPSVVRGEHGTACAGIIGAQANNDIGVAGIAPDCSIMSISNSLAFFTNPNKIADGFMFAATHGASVISNSWYSTVSDNLITDAINYALTQGRGGKGCVVVFAAGNDDSSVNYPANSIEDIIVVGAMSPCAMRKQPYYCIPTYVWGSNYGDELDIMAPGEYIPTTDLTGSAGYSGAYPPYNYTMNFDGTSAACPHVAAVAGLVLSENPYLTQKEVADIIESTAQKVGNYNYTTHSGRPNGTWNNEMGYGLVDAHAAVFAALDMKISGIDKLCSSAYYGVQNVPSTASVSWSYETDIQQIGNYPVLQLSNTTSSSIMVQRGSYLSHGSTILYSGYVTLKATVTHEGLSRTFSKTILLHQDITPTFPISSLLQIGWQESRTFTINNCTDVYDNNLKWVITMPNETTSTTYYGRSNTHPGTLNIKLYNLENCSTALYSNYNIVVNWFIPVDPILLFPNPVTTETVEIHVKDKNYAERMERVEDESPQSMDYTLELWDDNSLFVKKISSSLKGEEDIVKMDVSGLQNGVYILNLKMQNKIACTNKIIINH